MDRTRHYPKRIGENLRAIALYPLLLAMIICTILTLAIIYSQLYTWISSIESILDQREKDHLLRLSIARSQKTSAQLTQV